MKNKIISAILVLSNLLAIMNPSAVLAQESVYLQDFNDSADGWSMVNNVTLDDTANAPEGAFETVSETAVHASATGNGNRSAYINIDDTLFGENISSRAVYEFDFYIAGATRTCNMLTLGNSQADSYTDLSNTFFALGNGDGVGARTTLRYYDYELCEWITVENGNAVWLHLRLYADFETKNMRFIITDTSGTEIRRSRVISFAESFNDGTQAKLNRMILTGFRSNKGGVTLDTWIDNFEVFEMNNEDIEFVNEQEEIPMVMEKLSPVVMRPGEETAVTVTVNDEAAEITAVSSDDSVATVVADNREIKISASANGYATVTVTADNGKTTKTESFAVTVTDEAEESEPVTVSLIENSRPSASIVMDEAYSDEKSYSRIMRAAGDLRQDFGLVSGQLDANDIPIDDTTQKRDARLTAADGGVPEIITNADGKNAIIIGSIEESTIIKKLILEGRLDEAAQIRGNWEGYVIKTLKNPTDGIENAIIIAGTDTNGTVYGIYDLSQYIGVSPWYWWSDVPVSVKQELTYDRETVVKPCADVKYRGIFINDEEQLVKWCETKFPNDEVHGPNEYVYRHMFEAILRCGANTLWPAMHEYTTAFNTPVDENGIPVNAKAADEYGIFMSASHCEVMNRNNVGEWATWYEENKDRYSITGGEGTDGNVQQLSANKAYDYTINKEAILAYWRERVEANKDFKNIFVLGIRGVHDGSPVMSNLEGAGYGTGNDGVVAMMKDVITEQRKMIKEIYGSEDAVPQVFIPYKEMNTYYNHNNGELAGWLPDDIMIMYAEDNFGYLRQTTSEAERMRSGGSGVYYHNSYWGTPKSYLWLNSVPVTLMHEEMQKAYDTGSDRYWILNVGDLKPGELNMEFFLNMAYDIDMYNSENIGEVYYKSQAMRDYGLSESDAEIYADEMMKICGYLQTKRPEFFGCEMSGSVNTPSFAESREFQLSVTQHGDEAQRRLNEWNETASVLKSLYDKMNEGQKTAFYEQVYFAVLQNINVTQEYVYFWKNQQYSAQGRYGSSKVYAELSKKAIEKLDTDQNDFWSLNNNKWDKVINHDHIIGYQHNQGIVIVPEDRYTYLEPKNGVGAVCEGQLLPDDDVTLTFDSDADNVRFIDVFGKNNSKSKWHATTDADWIVLSKESGEVYTEERINVSVDYDKAQQGENIGSVSIYNDGEEIPVAVFNIKALKNDIEYEENTYAEANGYVVLEAEHFSDNIPGSDGSEWKIVPNLGTSGSSVKGYPDLADKVRKDYAENCAKLVYRVYFKTAGTFSGTMYRLPTLNEGSENEVARTNRVGIGVNSNSPTILYGTTVTGGTAWKANVMRAYEKHGFTVEITEPGYHDIVVYKIDSSICFDKIVINTGAVADNSLIGPPESPNNIAAAAQITPAEIDASVLGSQPGPIQCSAVYNNGTVYINTNTAVSAMVVFAKYNDDGTLAETEIKNIELSVGDTQVSTELAGNVKVFVWDSEEEMKPLCDVAGYEKKTYVSEVFDGYDVNVWSGTKPQLITDEENQYIQMETTTSPKGGYVLFDEIDGSNMCFEIEADIKISPADTAGNAQFAIGSSTPTFQNNSPDDGIVKGNESDPAERNSGYILAIEYVTGSTLFVNGESISTDFIGEWMHIKATADFTTKLVKITISDKNGNSETVTADFYSSLGDNESIGSIYMRGARNNGIVAADNLVIKSSEESVYEDAETPDDTEVPDDTENPSYAPGEPVSGTETDKTTYDSSSKKIDVDFGAFGFLL